jgi:outer membrane protein OmpA-like peptidoglycan-associated protein
MMSAFNNAAHSKATGLERQQLPPGKPDDGRLRLVLPGVAVAATLVLFGYSLVAGTAKDQAPVQSAGNVATSGAFAPGAGWISNLIALSGAVGRGAPGEWQGGSGQLFAASPEAGGLPQFAAASMMLTGTEDGRLAFATPTESQTKEAAAGLQSTAALNSLSIEFQPNSAKISAASTGTIKKAAGLIKMLPAGAEVDVIGYTSVSGNSHRALVLAQRRANSVYKVLVRLGVHPSMLKPQSSASAGLEASAKSAAEGRSSIAADAAQRADWRRVGFHVIEPQR